MRSMFEGATAFNGNISGWTPSSVTNMREMFKGATSFNGDITNWNTTSVVDVVGAFEGATSFNRPLNWNTSLVTSFDRMFKDASQFDQSVANLNIGNVTSMIDMFDGIQLSNDNYTNILVGWSGGSPQNFVTLDAGTSKYNSGATSSRSNLTSTYSWTIIDGGTGSAPNMGDTSGTFVTTVAGTTISLTNGGFAATSCVSNTALPTGLSVTKSGSTCEISGTATVPAPSTPYVITATGADGSKDSAVVYITVNAASPPNLANQTTYPLVRTVSISPISFTNTGSTVSSCSDSGLPPGLTVAKNGDTCEISGTPSAISGSTPYTIYGFAADGSQDSATITFSVVAENPPLLANYTDVTIYKNIPGSIITFSNTGQNASNCQISPTLPAGMTIGDQSNTCEISGTPTAIIGQTTFTVTADAADGSQDNATVRIEVLDPTPNHIEITTPPIEGNTSTCLGPITMTFHNAAHQPVPNQGTIRVALNNAVPGPPSGDYQVYSNAGCTNLWTNGGSYFDRTLGSSTLSESFYIIGHSAGSRTLNVTYDPVGLSLPVSQGTTFGPPSSTIAKMKLTKGGDGGIGACNPIDLKTLSKNDTPVNAAENISIKLTIAGGSGSLYTNNICTLGSASSLTSIIPNGTSTMNTVYYSSGTPLPMDILTVEEVPNFGWKDLSTPIPIGNEGDAIYTLDGNSDPVDDRFLGGAYDEKNNQLIMVGDVMNTTKDGYIYTYDLDYNNGTIRDTIDYSSNFDQLYDVAMGEDGDYYVVGRVYRVESGCNGNAPTVQLVVRRYDETHSLLAEKFFCMTTNKPTSDIIQARILYQKEGSNGYVYFLTAQGHQDFAVGRNLILRKWKEDLSGTALGWSSPFSATMSETFPDYHSSTFSLSRDQNTFIYISSMEKPSISSANLVVRRFATISSTPNATWTQTGGENNASPNTGGVSTTGFYNDAEYLWAIKNVGITNYTMEVVKLNLGDLTPNASGGCHGQQFGPGNTFTTRINDVLQVGKYLIVSGMQQKVYDSNSSEDGFIRVMAMNSNGTCDLKSETTGPWQWTGGTVDHMVGSHSGKNDSFEFLIRGPAPYPSFYVGGYSDLIDSNLDPVGRYYFLPQ